MQVGGTIPYLEEPSSQTITERIFPSEKEKRNIKQISIDSIINRPGIIKIFNKSVYILDYSPFPLIKKLDLETGQVIQKYGNGRGRGPGELINPTDFSVTTDGKLWISDQPQSKLAIFNAQGNHIDDWVIEFTPYKIASSNNNIAIYGFLEPIIKLVDNKQTVLWTSKSLVENSRVWSNLITGFLVSNDETIFKISNYSATIVGYAQNGEKLFFRKLINHTQVPIGKPIEDREFLSYQIDRSELAFAVADGFILGSEIHVLVQVYGDNPYQIFDVYSSVNGNYLYSYTLDVSLRSVAAFKNGTIIGLTPDKLMLWD